MKNFIFLAVLAAFLSDPSKVMAASLLSPNLSSFAILGSSTVTNVSTSTVVGNVGVSPGSSITGFLSSPGEAVSDPQVTGGLVHATTSVAASAQGELTTAIYELGLMGSGITLSSADLNGLTITPGVYTVPAGDSNLTGTVTLDGQGNANAAWVFQMPSTLITSSGSVVNVINTGSGAGVFWNVVSSATLGSSTSFEGNILALESITLGTNATINCGRALANNGAVTMQMNTVGIGCPSHGLSGGLTVPEGGGIPTPLADTPVPEPSSIVLGLMSLGSMLGFRRKKQCLI